MVGTDWQNHAICQQGRLQMEPGSLQGAPAPAHSPGEHALGRKTRPAPAPLPRFALGARGQARVSCCSQCEFTFVNKRCFGKSSSRAVSVHTQAWWQCGPVTAFLACFCLPGDGRDAWPLGDRSCGWRGLGLAALGATGLETVGPGGSVAEGEALWRPPWG